MGCCAEARKIDADTGPRDLPMPSITGKDKLTAYELRLPFARTSFKQFLKQVNDAHKENGEEGWTTLGMMSKHFPTKAWQELHGRDADMAHMLLSEKFRFEKHEDKISVRKLIMFALLHCQGPAEDKIESFYSILQDGGVEAHAQISASDKDFQLVITEMSNIVLGDIIHFSELPAKYTAEEVAKVADTI